MEWKQELDALLREYDQAVAEVQKNRKMFDGVMGLGTHPGSAACHEIMDKQVAELCQRAAAEEAPAEERLVLVRAIFEAEKKWKGPEYARLMLTALQRHTIPVIGLLPEADRQELADWYGKAYPRRNRLPVQEEVLAALMGVAAGTRVKRRWGR